MLFHDKILPLISLRLRLGTMLLDHAFVCVICLPIIFLFEYLIFPQAKFQVLSAPLVIFYFSKDCFCGRSFAKRVFNLVIIDQTTNKIASPIKCVIRNFFIIIWPIEVLISFFDQEQRIGDKVAGTKLVRYDPNIHDCKVESLDTFAAIVIASLVTIAFYIVSYWRF